MRMPLSERLAQLLKEAEVEHKIAVINLKATRTDWVDWYADYIAERLLDSPMYGVGAEAGAVMAKAEAGECKRDGVGTYSTYSRYHVG